MSDQLKNRDEISIRLATVPDALMLARLRYVFRSSISPACESEEEFVKRCSLWMQRRLQENNPWKCWIAEQGDTIIGNIWMQLLEKIPNPVIEPEYLAYITNFYVHEESRGQGIGSRLLSIALDWSKSQDVQAVILWPTEESRSLYLRHGFAVRDNLLELMLAESEDVNQSGKTNRDERR
jgi:GNAT superfamily N-acetyltransferase